jgi:gamma-glutamyltranspeptidase/glutathione hydrolase
MRIAIRHAAAAAAAAALALGPVGSSLAQTAPAPEVATGRAVKDLGTAQKYMVAAANPLAAAAGRDMLRAGGSAVDAAIAVQLVLNLVEPQSSGLGGGAFLVHWDQAAKRLTTLDGRETAPAAATPDRFLGADGKPMGYMQAIVGGRSVGVPGTPALLAEAHRRWGKLPWARLFEPAIRLADEGFAISPRLAGLLAQERFLGTDPAARALFFEADGSPKAAGTILKNPALAATFRAIAAQGAEAFYGGAIAEDVVAAVRGHPLNPGDMTLDDLKAYRVIERPAVCGRYRVFTICGMGPPSSGGIAVAQMLATLEAQPMDRTGPGAASAHLLAEAGRLAFADRARYLGDPAFVPVPVEGLLDRAYLADRARLIDPGRAMGKAQPGDPPGRRTDLAPSEGIEHGTSHIGVVDADLDAVAMTTTIEDGFGARVMTKGGFLLNNELTDFAFVPTDGDRPVANRVEPGKRPRSSMAPTIVFDAFGRLYAVVGSPGGSQIIGFVTQTLVGILDWRLDPQRAVDLGHVLNRNGPTELEAGTEAERWAAPLAAMGHEIRTGDMTSGIQAIVVTPTGFVGGADSRREGVAIGD